MYLCHPCSLTSQSCHLPSSWTSGFCCVALDFWGVDPNCSQPNQRPSVARSRPLCNSWWSNVRRSDPSTAPKDNHIVRRIQYLPCSTFGKFGISKVPFPFFFPLIWSFSGALGRLSDGVRAVCVAGQGAAKSAQSNHTCGATTSALPRLSVASYVSFLIRSFLQTENNPQRRNTHQNLINELYQNQKCTLTHLDARANQWGQSERVKNWNCKWKATLCRVREM